ncbi:MAG: hypothetical protein FJ254_03740 [Phycisphaerae bacterium]|nr:hypothetical protein [Phycisphaerae bacterium]
MLIPSRLVRGFGPSIAPAVVAACMTLAACDGGDATSDGGAACDGGDATSELDGSATGAPPPATDQATFRTIDPAAGGEPVPFVTDHSWPAWAQWPRSLGSVTLFHPAIEEWRGEQLFTRSAVECEGGLTGLVTLQWSIRFDGKVVTLTAPIVASCAWDGDPTRVAPCRADLDRGLAGCAWSFPIEAVLSLVSSDTMPPEPTVEQADALRRGRELARAFSADLLNDRETLYMLDRWPRDEVDRPVVPVAAAPLTAPCGSWVLGPLRVLGRDGRVHELRAARWIRLTRDGWTAPTLDAAAAQMADPSAGGSLSEARDRFERTIAMRDKVYGLLDRTAYRWSEAVARSRPHVDPPPPELPPAVDSSPSASP